MATQPAQATRVAFVDAAAGGIGAEATITHALMSPDGQIAITQYEPFWETKINNVDMVVVEANYGGPAPTEQKMKPCSICSNPTTNRCNDCGAPCCVQVHTEKNGQCTACHVIDAVSDQEDD